MRVAFIISLAIGAAILRGAPAASAQTPAAPPTTSAPFPRPSGAYPVGTRDYFWVDAKRGEPFTKDPNDQRHVLIQIWYPAAPAPGADPAAYIRTPEEFPDYLDHPVFDTWRDDAKFVLDQLEILDKDPTRPFYRRLDLDRIGALGWSFGGATAIQMTRDDPRVKAAVDQDGQLFGDVREQGTRRPVMLLHHAGAPPYQSPDTLAIYRELVAMVDGWDRTMLDRSTADRYEVWIANTQHVHFSDYPLFSTRQPPGELDPRRAHEIINAYTLAFFDRYLRGRDSDLLKGPSIQYSEATFKKR